MRVVTKNKARIWRFRITQNTQAGDVPLALNTVVRIWLSETYGGASINVAHDLNLARSTTNNRVWYGTMTQAAVNVLLGAHLEGDIIYVVVSVAGEVDSSPVKVQLVSKIA